jgi:hypothetical protein
MLGAVHGQAPPLSERLAGRVLGSDRPEDLAAVVGLFALFAIVDRLTQALAPLSRADVTEPTLVLSAIGSRWWLHLALAAVIAAGLRLRPDRMLCRWSALQHGNVLQRLAAALLVLLAWQGALYDVNYLAGQTHLADRLLVVVLAAAACYRPLFVIPFVVELRIVNQQFVIPFDTAATVNVDELLVLALVAIAAGHALYVVTGRNQTAPIVLVLLAAVAAHFFLPGRGKLSLDWFSTTDLSNLPLSSYTAGWRRDTDGSWPRFLAELYQVFHRPVLVATLAIELGAAVAVLSRRLSIFWLIGAVLFHLATLATTGFWFTTWIVLEVALVRLLTARRLDDWHAANATVGRAAVTALAATAAGPLLFHPPGLAWLDAPVSYGYEVEAVGESGTAYHVPASAFAPFDHELTFLRLQLGPYLPASGAYGAVVSAEQLDRLESITTFEELEAYEETLGRPTLTVKSEELVKSFMEHANRGERHDWYGIGPPAHFWTSRGEPTYDHDEPLTRLEVWLVRSIHNQGEPVEGRELVLVLVVDEGGQVRVG